MNSIEIFVACHKPSELPNNPIFHPIHVGAAISRVTLPGMQRDDEGENISAQNPQYCELTAQYWAWKHSEADYIGLCHYRRYLSFSKKRFTNFTPDNRKQILVKVLTPETEDKYGLLDQNTIQEIIASHDVLVGEAQDLSKVYTPFGTQSTTLKHWQAHDNALINVNDLEKLFAIVKRSYPDFYNSMREYMNGKMFYGFNTFVMRKDLYREMCEMEFNVLAQLEKKVDLTHYNQQLSRIYGFMGEILFSSFIYHIKKTRPDIRIGERQLLYFEKTDPKNELYPTEQDSVKVAIDLNGEECYLVYPALKTVIKTCDNSRKYDLIVLHNNLTTWCKDSLEQLLMDYPNIKMQFFDVSRVFASLEELYDIKLRDSSIFLPWMLPEVNRCIFLRWNVLVRHDIAALYDLNLEDKVLAASLDILELGRINTFYREDYNNVKEVLKLKDIYQYLNNEIVLMDMKKMRKRSFDSILETINHFDKLKHKLNGDELFNILWQGTVKILPQSWNWQINSSWRHNFYINEAPLKIAKEYREAKNNARIIKYSTSAPWHCKDNYGFFMEYWSIADESPFKYLFREQLILKIEEENTLKKKAWRQVERIFPKHSKQREIVKGILPKSGIIYQKMLKFIGRK